MSTLTRTQSDKRIGVFGGSFDPPHAAHVLVVSYLLMSSEVDEVLVVPTYLHPFDKPLSDFEHRLNMCRLAFEDFHRVTVSTIEAELGGKSRTIRTIEALVQQNHDASFRFVVGSDLVPETPRWFSFDQIAEKAPLLVVPRAKAAPEQNALSIPGISSTEVRRRITQGEDTKGWLPSSVARYIKKHSLYKTSRDVD